MSNILATELNLVSGVNIYSTRIGKGTVKQSAEKLFLFWDLTRGRGDRKACNGKVKILLLCHHRPIFVDSYQSYLSLFPQLSLCVAYIIVATC